MTADIATLRQLLADGKCLCSSASTDWDGVGALLDRLESAEGERDAAVAHLDTVRQLEAQSRGLAERLAEDITHARLRCERLHGGVKATGAWLNADGTTSPILPSTTMSAEVRTDWAAVATRVTGALAEAKVERDTARREADDLREALDDHRAHYVDHAEHARVVATAERVRANVEALADEYPAYGPRLRAALADPSATEDEGGGL